jgi:predicted TIM-barrel enzyme
MTNIWPVIHLKDDNRTIANAQVAARCGCPGVFLIAMNGDDTMIDPAAKLIRREVPDLKIGINMLSAAPAFAVCHSINHGYDATWSDYAWQDSVIEKHIGSRDHKFFAAVAMKGETHDEPNPEASAREAVARGFIPMTSGSGTGVTAPLDKIKRLRAAIGPDAPLAMSGVNPNRAYQLTPLATHFLVATCISSDFYTFEESKLRYLIKQGATQL